VSYGGVSGGLRAVQSAKLLVTTLKMVPLVEGVSVPMVSAHLDGDGRFVPNELHEASATALLGELRRWTDALTPMRQPTP
jgi:NAD(P)H-dependent FMN reductase